MAARSCRKRRRTNGDNDRKAPARKKRANVVFPYLPRDVIINILAKLPAKSIMRCMRVCRDWHDIIKDPCFAEEHDHNSHIALVGLRPRKRTMSMTESYRGVNCHKFYPGEMTKRFGAGFEVVNSCRGFLLIKSQLRELSMYNPLTHECIDLPLQELTETNFICGLGFSPTTNQYKVITFLKQDGIHRTRVLSAETFEWREIDGNKSVLDKIRFHNNNPLALNDSIHWLATGENIARFDVDKEEFSFVASPLIGDYNKPVISLGMLSGCLCVNIIDMGNRRHGVETWVMKEYGNTESWRQWCVVKNIDTKLTPKLSNFRIMECGEKGKIVIQPPSGSLICYDLNLQERTDGKLQVPGFSSIKKGMQLHFMGFSTLIQAN